MKVAMISTLLMFLVVLLVMERSSLPAFIIDQWTKVDVYNYVGEPIHVHCDHEDKTLEDGRLLGWKFTPAIFGNTKYTCSFRWGAKTREFPVWVDGGVCGSVAKRPCTHCVWRVTPVGFFRSEGNELLAQKIYNWP